MSGLHDEMRAALRCGVTQTELQAISAANGNPAAFVAALESVGICPLCDRSRPLTALRAVPGLRIAYHLAVCEDCAR